MAGIHKKLDALTQLLLDRLNRAQHRVARCHVMRSRIDRKARYFLPHFPGKRIEKLKAFYLIIKERQTYCEFGALGGKNINRLATRTERTACELCVIAFILHRDQTRQDFAARNTITGAQNQHHRVVVRGVTNTVNTGHCAHDHGVTALEQALGCRQAHLLDMLVDR